MLYTSCISHVVYFTTGLLYMSHILTTELCYVSDIRNQNRYAHCCIMVHLTQYSYDIEKQMHS